MRTAIEGVAGSCSRSVACRIYSAASRLLTAVWPCPSQPWITPSIFENTNNTDVVDEYTFGQLLNRDWATSTLEQHWNTWITEDDFEDIKAAGLNHVR